LGVPTLNNVGRLSALSFSVIPAKAGIHKKDMASILSAKSYRI